jgi:hypothetical protein
MLNINKKTKGKIILLVLIAVCLAVGVYLVLKIVLFNGLKDPKKTDYYADYSEEDRNIAEAYYPYGYEGYYYPALPLMSNWPYGNHATMINACQIPEEVLKNMPTEQLVQTVMAYPLWGDVLAYDSREMAYGAIKRSFNGLRELYLREDALECLEICPDVIRAKFTTAYYTISEYFVKDNE